MTTVPSRAPGFGNELPPMDPEFFRQHVVHTGSRRIAAYLLAYVIGLNGIWTVEVLEQLVAQTATYPGKPKRVELDRRVRQLSTVGWHSSYYQTEHGLRVNEHRLLNIGAHVWDLDFRFPRGHTSCPGPLRRATIAAADYTCALCGIRKGELHPNGLPAKMTAGRVVPGCAGGLYEPGNVRCECDACNEWARDQYDWGAAA